MSIWSSVEVDAWSRDFEYPDYLNIHKISNCVGNPLSEVNYQAFVAFMNKAMIEDFQNT